MKRRVKLVLRKSYTITALPPAWYVELLAGNGVLMMRTRNYRKLKTAEKTMMKLYNMLDRVPSYEDRTHTR